MLTLHAHFDGKVLVPDEPIDLPVGQRLLVQVETSTELKLTSGRDLLKFAGTLDPQVADEMSKAIEEGCGKVDLDGW